MNQKILVIEDDKEICEMVVEFLAKSDYEMISAHHGVEGLKLMKTCMPNLVILDIMLPYKSGDEVLREIRQFSDVPVIIISAKEMIQTKVDLFKLGADDYLTKPFDLNELRARIEVILNRYNKVSHEPKVLIFKELKMDLDKKQVFVNESSIILTVKEFELLRLMMLYPDKVYSKQNLYESIWNETYGYHDNAINTHISNVRKKIKEYSTEDYIKTIWGMGYKLT